MMMIMMIMMIMMRLRTDLWVEDDENDGVPEDGRLGQLVREEGHQGTEGSRHSRKDFLIFPFPFPY